MKNYTNTYLDHFGYCQQDWIGCEICNSTAVDIHHIQSRKRRPDLINDINNLMAVCRSCHIKHGEVTEDIEWLQEIHDKKLKGHQSNR